MRDTPLTFVTGNSGKFGEVQALIPTIVQADVNLPEVQSVDAQEVITAKLIAGAREGLQNFIVEDTGLYFDCLNGLPGPLIKWFQERLGNEGISDLVSHYESQVAHAITWIGYSSPTGEMHFFEGNIEGTIVSPRGDGFGWDPIFQPKGSTLTFGEMTREAKGEISMRKIAVTKLLNHLQQ